MHEIDSFATDAGVSDSTQRMSAFAGELERRFDELQAWALENWPETEARPAPSEVASLLTSARRRILSATPVGSAANQQVPEPADGGPQYISTTPAPWP